MFHKPGNRFSITLDDDPTVARIIEKTTQIPSVSFSSPQELITTTFAQPPVAVFIDIHLGLQTNGLDLIPSLREHWPFCPIIVITSDTTEDALSEALALGADDFIQKPIRPKELAARLQSRLGDLAQKEAKGTLRLGDITFHLGRRSLKGARGSTFLSPTAALILTHLIQAKGTVLQRQALKQKAWGRFAITENALDRKICELRKALADVSHSVCLKTIYGVGFSLGTRAAALYEEKERAA